VASSAELSKQVSCYVVIWFRCWKGDTRRTQKSNLIRLFQSVSEYLAVPTKLYRS